MSKASVKQFVAWRSLALVLALALGLFLAFYNLIDFPKTWFDEGSHLHVPKTLVRFGVYADYSSEGFRYYGPTVGVGPMVLLPIAAAFKIFGIGLLQARVVMAIYLLATIYVFFRLARELGRGDFAWIALALLISSHAVSVWEYGRQVLGEVPGLFFVAAGLWLWFRAWEKSGWVRLLGVGALLGLGMVTKYQYLVVLAPALMIAWILNLGYYRAAPQRVFLIPGITAGTIFGLWQLVLIFYLGPATASENFAMLRESAAGAAAIFSPELMRRSLGELLHPRVFLWLLAPALVYGFFLSRARNRDGQCWSVLYLIVWVNLIWYVFASISWLRYAFLGLSFSSLFIARFALVLTDGLRWDELWRDVTHGKLNLESKRILGLAVLLWTCAAILFPLGQTLRAIILPPDNAPLSMANYLNASVSRDALIETWEPELGLLTDHKYHFPPVSLLPKAVAFVWLDAPRPSQFYFLDPNRLPPYVLVGEFARWVQLYPPDALASRYDLITRVGVYELYGIRK